MASKQNQGTSSPSASSLRLPLLGRRSRRGSLASLSSRSQVDRATLAQALDQIHSSASQSETLTTFDEFASPPPASTGSEGKSFAGDLVHGGLSGLYNRIRHSVSGSREANVRPVSGTGNESADESSVKSVKGRAVARPPKKPSTAVSSPNLLSTPVSRLQSPLSTTVADSRDNTTEPSEAPGITATPRAPTVGYSPPSSVLPTTENSIASATSVEPLNLDMKDGAPLHFAATKSHSRGDAGVGGTLGLESRLKSLEPRVQPSQAPSDSASTVLLQPKGSQTDSKHVLPAPLHRQDEFDPDENAGSDSNDDDIGLGDDGLAHTREMRSATREGSNERSSHENPSKAQDHPMESQMERHVTRSHDPETPYPSVAEARFDSLSGENAEQRAIPVNHPPAQQRPSMVHISQSHLPGFKVSRPSSTDGGDLDSASQPPGATHIAFKDANELPLRDGALKTTRGADHKTTQVQPQVKRRVLSKRFWMKDENARECFYCGNAFSTFRRKHHCRTCGQIFDGKCTILLPGALFGQSGSIRLCKPCEGILYGHDDNSSVFSEDEDLQRNSYYELDDLDAQLDQDHTNMATPTIGIPVSRRTVESKRRSAVLEFDGLPALARPSSSRSLKSLSGRPRSSSHKRHHSRHQHMRNFRSSFDDRAPFQRDVVKSAEQRSLLPAFHTDSIIDPDLAPFMSDEDSSDDQQTSIFAMMNGDMYPTVTGEDERNGLAGLLAAVKKGRSRASEKNVTGLSLPGRDVDNISLASKPLPRPSRRRNLSVSSINHPRLSPRRSKSHNLLKGFEPTIDGVSGDQYSELRGFSVVGGAGSMMMRSSAMRGTDAPAVELNRASLQHVRKLLKQLLQDATIPNPSRWEKALIPILLQCTDDVEPDVQNGDDLDIRHYIKLKKVPGGRPGDTSYVSGVVFSKNVALKNMPRSVPQPRIAIVTFALEYSRHGQHFMSLEPVIAQEREYLRNLVNRIAALRPQILLVQRNVSGLALQYLDEANITVAYNIKESVLNAVARCTQTRMISSEQRLPSDPSNLGSCESFDVKTYVHKGRKKTYLYLSGCTKSLGCTIVLRGAEIETLRSVKRITEFMCYVVYNLKLETSLMRDEFVLIPSSIGHGDTSPSNKPAHKAVQETPPKPAPPSDVVAEASSKLKGMVEKVSKDADSVADFSKKDVFANPSLPNEDAINKAKGTESLVADDIQVPDDLPMPTFYGDMVEKHKTKILSASPFVHFMQPYLLMRAREQERRLVYLKRLRDQYGIDEHTSDKEVTRRKFELVKPEMVHSVVKQPSKQVRDFLHAVHDAEYDKAMHNYQTQKRQWESYIAGNINLFDPFTHQKLVVLHSVVSSVTSVPCSGPELMAIGFYAQFDLDDQFESDVSLGQWVENLCYAGPMVCKANGCGRRFFDHHRQYVHGDGQLSVFVQRYPSKMRRMQGTILMWSCCRICGQETQVTPMSENSWKYSFGKYLELSFWSTALHPRAGICPHDIHRDHVRYFGFQDVAIRIQYDTINLYEVIVPRTTITWKVDADLRLKNEQFLKFEERLNKFMVSVKSRLKSVKVDSVAAEKSEACKSEIDKLLKRTNDEHDFLLKKLQDKYMSSRYYELIPLNRTMRAMDEKALEWDEIFTDFERNFFPSEKDIRRLATLQLKRLFLDRTETAGLATSIEEGNEEVSREAESAVTNNEPATSTSSGTPMACEKTDDMLTSVVKENHSTDVKFSEGVESHEKVPEEGISARAAEPIEVQPSVPVAAPLQAIDREDVRHLDLAVSSNFSEITMSNEQAILNPNSQTRSPIATRNAKVLSESVAPDPAPLNPTITQRIEQMRSEAAAGAVYDGTQESKILRPTPSGTSHPPPLYRAQSQPANSPRRDMNYSSDSSVDIDPVPSVAFLSTIQRQSESQKPNFSDSAKSVEKRMSERLGLGGFRPGKTPSSLIPRSIPSKKINSKVSTLAKHFEQLSREFEKERLRERRQRAATSRQARANPLASSQPVVEVYHDAHEAVQEREPPEETLEDKPPARSGPNETIFEEDNITDDTAPTTTSHSPVESRHGQDTTAETTDIEEGLLSPAHPPSDAGGEEREVAHTVLDDIEIPEGMDDHPILSPMESHLDLDLDMPKHQKSSMMKMLANFWSDRSASGWLPLEYPLTSNEHVFDDSDIIVREDEPSSVIALGLSCADYITKLQKSREAAQVTSNGQSKRQNPAAAPLNEESAIEASLLGDTGTHTKYSFAHGQVKVQCKIFYVESFDALRRKCGVADRFVESLSRCLKWDSKGGKTKSLFLKTLDDRFVIKSLQEVEVKSFIRGAPDYFNFVSHTLFHGLPSVIAKMFGLFQVVIKNPNTNVEFNWYLLVMENLFYDRNPNRRFDLKGSMRNRKIESTGQADEVLLDENLVETIFESPLFVREHSKKLLKASVYNDTLWLSKQNIMDYSLMAGFDDERKELIVGIIDCIRTYTWDKRIESWWKRGDRNKPTITSPKEYRNRFRVSMMNYVLQAPNCWHQYQAQQIYRRPLRIEWEGKKGVQDEGPSAAVAEAQTSVMEAEGAAL